MDNLTAVKNSWNQWSDTWYRKYRTDEAISTIINTPESAFHRTTYSIITRAFPNLNGKKVLVPSSGDNHAVFAFHLMGAQVTSCDISEKQLAYSSEIANIHGWDIEFICEDTMALRSIKSNEFDFVYTSNGVHVWISDLHAMYENISRVLRPNGTYIMFDIHPFMRPFGITTSEQLSIVNPYDSTGPFGEVPTFKWRIQDIMNAMISSGLSIASIEEMYAEDGSFWIDDSVDDGVTYTKHELESFCNWKTNPLAALPQWLSLHAVKQCSIAR